MWLAVTLTGTGCGDQASALEIEDDLFAADGVALPAGSSPEIVIRAIANTAADQPPEQRIIVDYKNLVHTTI